MDLSLLLGAFLLGLAASPSCLAVCMPIMVPMIVADRGSSARGGLFFSIYLSAGRLLSYVGLAAVTGYLGHTLFGLDAGEDAAGDQLAPRLIMGTIALLLLVYSVALYKGWLSPLTCPKRLLPSMTKAGGGGELKQPKADGKNAEDEKRASLLPLGFGMLLGSIICPPFLILLGSTLVSSGMATAALAALLFWCGTLPAGLLAGGVSGGLGKRWQEDNSRKAPFFVSQVSAITLFMVGLWWLLLVLV